MNDAGEVEVKMSAGATKEPLPLPAVPPVATAVVGNGSVKRWCVKVIFISLSPKATEAGDNQKHNSCEQNRE